MLILNSTRKDYKALDKETNLLPFR